MQTNASEPGLLESSSDPPGLRMESPLVCKHLPLSPVTYNPEDIGPAMAPYPGCSSWKAFPRRRMSSVCLSLAWQRPRGGWTAWNRVWSTHPSMRTTALWIATARSPATAGTGGTGERPPRRRGGQTGPPPLPPPTPLLAQDQALVQQLRIAPSQEEEEKERQSSEEPVRAAHGPRARREGP